MAIKRRLKGRNGVPALAVSAVAPLCPDLQLVLCNGIN